MNLHIDTTNHKGISVTVSDGKTEYHMQKETKVWASQILLPAIVELMKKNKLTWGDITSVTVEKGPGSYTGIRVGIAIAQTISWVRDIPLNGKKNNRVEAVYEGDKFGKMIKD